MTFVEALKSGLSDYDDIEDYIDAWHEGKGNGKSISEYLGMTKEQYFRFLKGYVPELKKMFKRGSK